MMKIKYLFFLIVLVYVSFSVTAQDLCLLKTFNINGREETKKVKIVQESEYYTDVSKSVLVESSLEVFERNYQKGRILNE